MIYYVIILWLYCHVMILFSLMFYSKWNEQWYVIELSNIIQVRTIIMYIRVLRVIIQFILKCIVY